MTLTNIDSKEPDVPMVHATELGPISEGPVVSNAVHVVEVASGSPTTTAVDSRKSHLCCGSCCDVRTGSIIVNTITLIFSLIILFFAFADAEQLPFGFSTLVYVVLGVYIGASGIGIIGAYSYNKYLVAFTGIFYCVDGILEIVGMNWGRAAVPFLFAYPNIVLVHELNTGGITPENFATERFCCSN